MERRNRVDTSEKPIPDEDQKIDESIAKESLGGEAFPH